MSEISFRWGIPAFDNGFTTIPNFMMRYYAQAGLTRNEFLCILHLASYKYESEGGQSSPSLKAVALEMGYAHKNSVYSLTKALRAKNMLTVEERPGYTSVYNFKGFSQVVLGLWEADKKEALEGITVESDTPLEEGGGITVGSDGVVQPTVTEEEESEEETFTPDPYGSWGGEPAYKRAIGEAIAEACNVVLDGPDSYSRVNGEAKKVAAKEVDPPYSEQEILELAPIIRRNGYPGAGKSGSRELTVNSVSKYLYLTRLLKPDATESPSTVDVADAKRELVSRVKGGGLE